MKCCDMTAGKLRNSIQLQQVSRVPNGSGGFTTTWTTYATVKAMMKPISGSERLHAMKNDSQVRLRAVIRYRSDVQADDRVYYPHRDEAMNITAVMDLEERHRWLQLDLEEGVAVNGA